MTLGRRSSDSSASSASGAPPARVRDLAGWVQTCIAAAPVLALLGGRVVWPSDELAQLRATVTVLEARAAASAADRADIRDGMIHGFTVLGRVECRRLRLADTALVSEAQVYGLPCDRLQRGEEWPLWSRTRRPSGPAGPGASLRQPATPASVPVLAALRPVALPAERVPRVRIRSTS